MVSTWRNGYCVNTGHLERCPHKQLKEAQKIFDWAVTHLNPDPAKRFIQALSSCCRWAVRNELIDRNPFEGLSKDINPDYSRNREPSAVIPVATGIQGGDLLQNGFPPTRE